MMHETLETAPVLAAVDIGSNSFRLEMARLLNGRYQRTLYIKETVRLGGGLDAEGHLTPEAIERGLACLQRFAEQLRDIDPAFVRAVATQTLREARNRDAFLLRAQEALKHGIEVIAGREEARLIYVGVSHLQPGTKKRLVIDIGGRSTEMILGTGMEPRVAESFAVGSVGLSQRYFGDGRLTADAFQAAQVAAGAELEEVLATFAPSTWTEALGSSGTVSAVAQVLTAAGRGPVITPDGLRWCIEQCLEAGHIDRLALPGLRDDRRPIVAGGLSLLYTLCMQFGIKRLEPSKGALRQGVIIELHQRLQAQRAHGAQHDGTSPAHRPAAHGDGRERTVLWLRDRFGANPEQARRVCDTALAFGRQLPLDAVQLQELSWAATLHEIGHRVSHHDHHRHSAYLLQHADAAGFSHTDLRRLSVLALGQRGGLRKIESDMRQPGVAAQVMALRLAVIVCHARALAQPAAMQITLDGNDARLGIARAWAEAQPRTLHLLAEEAQVWRRDTAFRLTLDIA